MELELIKTYLSEITQNYEIQLNNNQLEKFYQYAKLLVEYNEKINLTTILDPYNIAVKHFLDSIIVTKFIDIKKIKTLIDVGTGAGFPGVPIKILHDDLSLTLLDGLNKRINFLNDLTSHLQIKSDNIHMRAEEGGKNPKLRETFDLVTARAVAHLSQLAEYCLPYTKINGLFVALKGPDSENEITETNQAIKILGGSLEKIEKITLPNQHHRTLIIFRKISQTPTKYPRNNGQILKSPIK